MSAEQAVRAAGPGLTPPRDVPRLADMVEKGQQLAGHKPDGDDRERSRRILSGEISAATARAEVRAKSPR